MRYGNIEAPNIIDTTCEVVHDKFIDDYTKLLLHCDGADAAVTMVDSAKNATVTFAGTAQIDTAQSKFGGSSLLLDGNSDYVTLPDSENWKFGNGDFSIDMWVRFNALPSSDGYTATFASQYVDSDNRWAFYLLNGVSDNYLSFYLRSGAVDSIGLVYVWTPSLNTWYHLALTRNGNDFRMFLDGTIVATANDSSSMPDLASVLRIGYWGFTNTYMDGWIDELRISKGIARWTANFTPATQSYDCPLDTQTKLLIHGGGLNNAVTFYDDSTIGRTLTTVGTTKFDSTQYKHRISSILFDGNSDYITAPDSDDFYFGTGNFTIDFWVRFNTITNAQMFVGQKPDAASYWFVYKDTNANGNKLGLYFRIGGVVKGEYIMTNAWSGCAVGTWYHLCYERIGTSAKIFIDGVSQALTSAVAFSTNDVGNIASPLNIGATTNPLAGYVDGWMDEVRVSKGIIRWDSDFTPPAAPYDSPLSQYIIDGLNGDVDKEYRIILKNVTAINSSYPSLYINGDSGSNYGVQIMYGANASAAASRPAATTFWPLYTSSSLLAGYTIFGDFTLSAKSGKVRTGLYKATSIDGTTTILDVAEYGNAWNNTADNITSLRFASYNAAPCYGVGTHIILLKKRELATGAKTGDIVPVGRTYGHWQKIYDNTLTAAKTNVMLSSQMDAYTKLLIHADGADAATAFYDFSNSAHAITAVGTAQVDTAQSKFGGASLFLDGNSDYLTVPDSADWNFGSGDFTIDCWVRFNAHAGAHLYGFFGQYVDSTHFSQFFWNNTGALQFYAADGGIITNTYCTWTPTDGVWYHLAVVRNGSNCLLFIDGVSQTVTGGTFSGSIPDLAAVAQIGLVYTVDYMDGWIDEMRVSKGIARWTANFTPPTRAYNELDGDRDVLYKIIGRCIQNGAGSPFFVTRINMDAGSNYGNQILYGTNVTVAASRNVATAFTLGYGGADGNIALGEQLIYAKSGFLRPIIRNVTGYVAGTTVGEIDIAGNDWNNATDKITSLLILASVTDAMKIGTHLELWRLNL